MTKILKKVLISCHIQFRKNAAQKDYFQVTANPCRCPNAGIVLILTGVLSHAATGLLTTITKCYAKKLLLSSSPKLKPVECGWPAMDYYQENHEIYYEQTVAVNPSVFLNPLLSFLSDGIRVLDVGCGSGRDLLWLKKRGFVVIGFERSEGLAKKAEALVGCPIIRGDFSTYDFSKHFFDAVLLVGALVHLPHEQLDGVLARILECLAPGGILLLSLKKGNGRFTDATGRTFFLWQEESLEPVFNRLNLELLALHENVSALGKADTWLACYLRRGEMP